MNNLKITKLALAENNEILNKINLQELKDIFNKLQNELKLKESLDIIIYSPPKKITNTKEMLRLIKEYHESLHGGHCGIKRCVNKLKQKYVWKNMNKMVKKHINNCEICAKIKITKYTKEQYDITETPNTSFEVITIDTVGPLIPSNNYRYILTLQCELTKFVEAIPLETKEAVNVAKAIVEKFILKYGCFKKMKTDKGTEFTNELLKNICKLLKIEKVTSTPFHHETLGTIERNHRVLNDYLMTTNNVNNWDSILPYYVYSYNSTPHTTTNYTPFELVYGKLCALPCEILESKQKVYDIDNYCNELKLKLRHAHYEAKQKLINSKKETKEKSKRKDNTEPSLNKEFTQQLAKLIRIMVPKLFCYETGLLTVHTCCLISRTFLSIFVAALEGEIVKFIVRKDIKQFAIVLVKWFGIAIPATFINSMIRFLESKLALSFRTRLVKHSYQLYFKNQNYYRVSNLDGRVENADHRLTEDISVFSSSIAHLYSSLTKPCFDLMLIGLTLMRSSQKMKANILSGPALAVCVISLTAYIMRIVSPKFGQLVSEEANRYAYLRHIHSRIITNAEEIAFYGGHKVELQQLRQAYNRLAIQMNNIFIQKLWFIMLEQFFMKYVWSGTGMVMVSLPILTSSFQRNGNNQQIQNVDKITTDPNISERTQYLTTARNLLISAADAIERLMSSYKEIVALAGYTYRVAGMIEVLQDTAQGVYKKTTVDEKMYANNIIEFRNGTPIAKGKIIYFDEENDACISLHSVPVVTPNCDIVIPNLTLCIKPGMHLLITGPNGCGKSSLFRILSGMWPIYSGELHIPRPVEGKPCMFYIPQRPYMSIGSLCDQIIYPDNRDDMKNKGITINELKRILKMVNLEHIAQRDSFDGIRDWKDILSGGEKQRMAIARLFYHKPKYALLDECTSAVSIDIESSIYEEAKNMGITLLTITHRPTLWKYHTHILEFDGQGNWNFRKMEPNEQQRRKVK